MVPVCDKRYHIYNRFRHFWAEIKKLWNYPLIEWPSQQQSVHVHLYISPVTMRFCNKHKPLPQMKVNVL